MARRRLTLKRIDPWSVLKFGFVANLALLAIWLLGAGIIWFFVRQLELIEKVCEIASDVGFVDCGVNGGNLFRALLLLGLLGTVIQTGLVVFLAFLHNLIADLVGGISFTYTEEGGATLGSGVRTGGSTATRSEQTRRHQVAGAGTAAGSTAAGGPPPPLGAEDDGGSGGRSRTGAPSTDATDAAGGSGTSAGDERSDGRDGSSSSGATTPSGPSSPSTGSGAPGSSGGSSGGPAPTPGPSDETRERRDPGSSAGRSGSGPDWDLFGPRGGGSGGSGS